MFGFLRRRLGREHRRLVDESREMKTELSDLAEAAATILGFPDAVQALERCDKLDKILDEYDEWMLTHDHLPAVMSGPLLKIWRILRAEIDSARRGKEAARDRFG